jgi:membrane peptidoglycan carboxypeptidase
MYLNENPYGGTIYGVEEASSFYFGKHASEVTLAEAAYLASMPQAPTTYSPYGKHRSALDRRKNLVLRNMLNQGYIDLDQYKEAKNEEVQFVFRKKNSGIKAPHFVMFVRKQLEKMYSPEELKSGGLRVYTTLDYDLQEKIQEIVKKNIDEAEKKNLKVNNGAVVAINPKTGEIIAMVGSKDYFAKDIDGKFNVATAKRQPGSTFKPFAYLTAFQNGYTPKTVLWDVKTEFSDACDPDYKKNGRESSSCYHPNNFDHKFKGHILMEEALPQSRNIPAIKTLYLAGLDNTFKNIKLMGIESLDKPASHYGLSLVLGAGEVNYLT